MNKIVFSKYNRDRKKEFQISTTIYENDGKRYARKSPITEEARKHVAQMEQSCGLLNGVYENVRMLEANTYDDNGAVFDFVKGQSVTDMLLKAMAEKEKTEFLFYLKDITGILFQTKCETNAFEKTAAFTEVFGNVEVAGNTLPVTNVDLIFDNIIKKDESFICLDYEWVFDFPVPADFVLYRSLHYFYTRNIAHFGGTIAEAELMNAVGIPDGLVSVFAAMEASFQQWVFGDENYTVKYVQDSEKNVLQNYKVMKQRVLQLQQEQEDRNKHIAYLDGEIEKRDEAVSSIRSELVDKDMMLRQKEALISELARINTVKDEHIANLRRGYDKWMKLTAPYHFVKRKAKGLVQGSKECYRNLKPEKLVFPTWKQPMVSIVIPVYNEFEYTWNCLKSILEYTKDVSYEVIIGDDMSNDKTAKLNRYVKGIKVIRNEENLKFLKNCNNAAKEAAGKYIFFLNNDTQVSEGWLSNLVELIESDDTIGMVGSKLIYPDGTLQEAGGILWKDASAWNYGRNDDAAKPEYNYVRETDYISGAAIMIRHELWNEIGGFDELFAPAYCEDSDLAFEVRKRGKRVVYQPKSVVTHFEGVSNGTDLSSGLKKYQVENNVKFKEKWEKELEQHYDNGTAVFRAKERNYDKKVVLIVDHYVPTFDKDAGSKTTFQYIKMFLKKGYVVKFIGDNFAQMEPYTTVLQQLGVEVLYGPWYAQHIFQWIEENQQYIDFAYLNRPHITEKYIHFFTTRTNIKVIYYGHDLCFLREQREAELTGDKELMQDAENWKNKELGIMRKAQMSYYPSVVEIDAIHELDANIKAKAITAYVFNEFKENFSFQPQERQGLLFVGGFSHGPNVDAVKWFVQEIYPLIWEKEEIPFYIVGSNAPEEIKQLEGNGVVCKGFLTEEELAEMYQKARVVVVPLRYGAGVKGKVIEAIYQGVPVVTTSVGAEGIVGIEEIAVIRDTPGDIAEELLNLYHNKEQLVQLAEKSQTYIKEHFSVDAAWKVIEEDFM